MSLCALRLGCGSQLLAALSGSTSHAHRVLVLSAVSVRWQGCSSRVRQCFYAACYCRSALLTWLLCSRDVLAQVQPPAELNLTMVACCRQVLLNDLHA